MGWFIFFIFLFAGAAIIYFNSDRGIQMLKEKPSSLKKEDKEKENYSTEGSSEQVYEQYSQESASTWHDGISKLYETYIVASNYHVGKKLTSGQVLYLSEDMDDGKFKQSVGIYTGDGKHVGFLDQADTKWILPEIYKMKVIAYNKQRIVKTKLFYQEKQTDATYFSQKLIIAFFGNKEKEDWQVEEELKVNSLNCVDKGLKKFFEKGLTFQEKIQSINKYTEEFLIENRGQIIFDIFWHAVKLMDIEYFDKYPEKSIKEAKVLRNKITRLWNKKEIVVSDIPLIKVHNLIDDDYLE